MRVQRPMPWAGRPFVPLLVLTPVVAGGIVAAYGLTVAPVFALTALAALAAIFFVVTHLTMATAVLVSSFYFEGYLTESYGNLNPSKLIGALAFLAWIVAWARRRRELVTPPHLWFMGGLGLSIVLSMALARDSGRAVFVASRYAMFFALFFLLVQAVRDKAEAKQTIDVVVLAAGASALIGLLNYVHGEVDRASGPLENPNDFAFVLASTVPLALYRISGSTTLARKIPLTLALLAMFAAILASFSRAALVGLAVAGGWAIATRRLRLRWGALAAAAVLATGAFLYLTEPELVRTTFTQKQDVSQRNVEIRLTFWHVAWQQFKSSPALGVGPGQYEAGYVEFQYPYAHDVTTTHNAYLNVLAELGAVGLVLFTGFLALCWARLRRRFPHDPDTDRLMAALAGGFVVVLVGAMFMTEQFYPPLWFLPALAVSLTEPHPRHVRPLSGGPAVGGARALAASGR